VQKFLPKTDLLTVTPYQMRTAEMEIKKGENLIVHRDEIMSRPARTWFQTEREKKLAQGASRTDRSL
jgi:hypothetical protein